MAKRKCCKYLLKKDRVSLNINGDELHNHDEKFIKQQKLFSARWHYYNVQKQAADIRQQYLTDQSEEYTGIHKIPTEQALWAILHAENSHKTYKQICGIIGHKKDRYPLAEIEVIDPGYQDGRIITLTNQKEVNEAIHCQNQNHTRQQLQMLFASISSLAQDIDPENSSNIISRILDGECIDIIYEELLLSDIEKQWTWELTWEIDEEEGNHATIQNFFKAKKGKMHILYQADT